MTTQVGDPHGSFRNLSKDSLRTQPREARTESGGLYLVGGIRWACVKLGSRTPKLWVFHPPRCKGIPLPPQNPHPDGCGVRCHRFLPSGFQETHLRYDGEVFAEEGERADSLFVRGPERRFQSRRHCGCAVCLVLDLGGGGWDCSVSCFGLGGRVAVSCFGPGGGGETCLTWQTCNAIADQLRCANARLGFLFELHFRRAVG